MSKTNTWFNRIDRMFLLSPSFYAIFSGALIGAAINLLTGSIFTREMLSIGVILATFFLLVSSGLLVYIGLILEDLRSKAGGDVNSLSRMIRHRRRKLWSSFFLGIMWVIISIILLCYTMKVIGG